MGIAIDLLPSIFDETQSVLPNTSLPYSKSKKKISRIACHSVNKGLSKTECKKMYLNTDLNTSYMLTKSSPGGEKRKIIPSFVLHYVTD